MINNPYSQYLENQVTTATPGKLLVMTYDAAIRFIKLAAEKMTEHKLDEQSANIIKAQNILLELISSLNTKVDPQLAANLHSIYNYMFDRLTEANLHDDQQALAEVLDIMTELRSTWAEAELMIRSGSTAGTETSARAA